MTKYHLFSGNHFYPSAGLGDYIESFDNVESARVEAKKLADEEFYSWASIIFEVNGNLKS